MGHIGLGRLGGVIIFLPSLKTTSDFCSFKFGKMYLGSIVGGQNRTVRRKAGNIRENHSGIKLLEGVDYKSIGLFQIKQNFKTIIKEKCACF